MSVYVSRVPVRGMVRLTADTDVHLNRMARRLGIGPEQARDMGHPVQGCHHYRLTDRQRRWARQLGARRLPWWVIGERLVGMWRAQRVSPVARAPRVPQLGRKAVWS